MRTCCCQQRSAGCAMIELRLSIFYSEMRTVKNVRSFEQLKVLADSRRLEILRLLMASPATVTQLARRLEQSPAWIRHHVVKLRSAGLVEVDERRRTGRVSEVFYRAEADALHIQEVITPRTRRHVVILSGSHDLALEAAAERLAKSITLIYMPVGSLDGLANLRQGICHVAGTHLLDEGGEYNTPTLRRLFADRRMDVITLAQRTQGLILPPGNPKAIRGLMDLARADVRYVHRNPGSGTQVWIDLEFRRKGIAAARESGRQLTTKTHTEAARLVHDHKADAAVGLQAAAHLHALEFIPLFEERFDLVLPHEQEAPLSPLLDYLHTAEFRHKTAALSGYTTGHSGESVPLWETFDEPIQS